MIIVIKQLLGKVVQSGRVCRASSAEIQSFVQTKYVIDTLINSVSSNTRCTVPSVDMVGKLMDGAVEKNRIHHIECLSTTNCGIDLFIEDTQPCSTRPSEIPSYYESNKEPRRSLRLRCDFFTAIIAINLYWKAVIKRQTPSRTSTLSAKGFTTTNETTCVAT